MKIAFLITFLSLFCLCTKAQTNLDSLYVVWQDETTPDSLRVEAYYNYIRSEFLFTNPDTAFTLAEEMAEYGRLSGYRKAEATAYNIQGISFAIRGNYPKTLGYFQRSLKINKEIGDKGGIAQALSNIAGLYYQLGEYPKTLEYLLPSSKIFEEIGDRRTMAKILTNIGSIYLIQKNYPIALENYERALATYTEFENQEGISNVLSNMGEAFTKQGQFAIALDYNERSLEIREAREDKSGIANSMGNIGQIYTEQEDYPQALLYLQRRLKINEEIGNKKDMAASYGAIGNVYNAQGEHNKALSECQRSLDLSKEIGVLSDQQVACACLYQAYKGLGKDKKALLFFEQTQVLSDSLNAEETNKKLLQMEFAKQVLADSLATEEEARLVKAAHEEEVRDEKQTRNIAGIIGILILIIAGGIYSRLRYIRKSRAVLQVEKDRSEDLLLNILPADIAEELKAKGRADARDFDMVSILFTDFKGFTEASAKLSAQDLVSEINTCFEAFDGIMSKYHIEKIKTIGDAYMAAGGLPVPTNDSTKNTVLAALEMQAFISKRKIELDAAGKPAFEMRVGIHTGPVVAGIVGVKKYQYDIWGDTVNTASRIESEGEVGQVNISQSTYELLKTDTDFTFESRGKIQAKGKGEIEMYFVSKA